MSSLKGQTAIVTGASSGIGEWCARVLAEQGADLVLVARRLDRLEKLGAELTKSFGIRTQTLALDLSQANAAQHLFDATEGQGRTIDILVNNAGFGTQNPFADIGWEKTSAQLQLNVIALTELTWRFVRPMRERNRGYILNVASIGAFMPVPGYATYGAGKAYVRNFSEAVAHELRASQVRVCCLCPGATATEFLQVSGQTVPGWQKMAFMSAERCARIGISAMLNGKRLVISGWDNAVGMWLLRFLPRRLITWIAAKFMEN